MISAHDEGHSDDRGRRWHRKWKPRCNLAVACASARRGYLLYVAGGEDAAGNCLNDASPWSPRVCTALLAVPGRPERLLLCGGLMTAAEVCPDGPEATIMKMYAAKNRQGLKVFHSSHKVLVMELAERPLQPGDEVAADMKKAVEGLHQLGYVHLDLKPANFLLKRKGRATQVCLADFGTVLRAETEVPHFVGTAMFAAPGLHGPYPVTVNPSHDHQSLVFAAWL
eukprot:s196_g31.t1